MSNSLSCGLVFRWKFGSVCFHSGILIWYWFPSACSLMIWNWAHSCFNSTLVSLTSSRVVSTLLAASYPVLNSTLIPVSQLLEMPTCVRSCADPLSDWSSIWSTIVMSQSKLLKMTLATFTMVATTSKIVYTWWILIFLCTNEWSSLARLLLTQQLTASFPFFSPQTRSPLQHLPTCCYFLSAAFVVRGLQLPLRHRLSRAPLLPLSPVSSLPSLTHSPLCWQDDSLGPP